ncbi:MAG: TonB-dependent receptor [Nibricoccus sp.]
MRFSALPFVLLVLFGWLVQPGTARGQALVQEFDLQAGDAAGQLRKFSEITGREILFAANVVRGVRTNALRGRLTVREALNRLLAGTPLLATEDAATGAIAVVAAPPEARDSRPPQEPPVAVPESPASSTQHNNTAAMKIKPTKKFRSWMASLFVAASVHTATAQDGTAPAANNPAQNQTPPDNEVIALPSFSVNSERDTSYTGKQALSTTRTGTGLEDLAQTVAVLNQAFLKDMSPSILAKSLNYVGGAQTGTISWSVDRFMMRGFVGEGDYVDGFRTMTDRNTDMALIDHVEIIKGPAAIFIANAANTVGGVINKVSKSPTEYYAGTLTVQVGEWDANRVEADVTGPITKDKKLQGRVIAVRQQANGYYDNTYDNRFAVLPMLLYRWDDRSEAYIKFESFDCHYSSYNGIPLDGTNYVYGQVYTPTLLGVPRRWNVDGEDAPKNWRTDRFYRLWGQFTTRPADWIAIRLAAFDSKDTQRRVESILNTINVPVTVNGATVTIPGFQIPPGYVRGNPLTRTTTAVNGDVQPRRELQNDYIFTFSTGPVNHKLLVGGDLVDYPQDTKTYSSGGTSTASSTPIDPFNPPYKSGAADTVYVNFDQPPVSFNHIQQNFAKFYFLDTANFLKNRVIVNWGVTRSRYESSRTQNNFNQVTQAATADSNIFPSSVAYKNLVQYGLVVKPLPNVSVFYGNSKNFSFNGFGVRLDGTSGLLPASTGEQKEIGVKSTWLKETLNINATYFDVKQANNTVPVFPQTNPPSVMLVGGEVSRGFDGDWSYEINKNIYLMGSFAYFDAKIALPAPWNQIQQPYDAAVHSSIPVNNVSEKNFSLWARYAFTSGILNGLSVGLGTNYLAKRAITDNANFVCFGYIPARTLMDLAVIYRTKRFTYQLNVDNLLDKKYIYAARSQLVMLPGAPLNLRASITYKFF